MCGGSKIVAESEFDRAWRELSERRDAEDYALKMALEADRQRKLRQAEDAAENGTGKPRTHLVIGDSHAKPGVPNRRYTILGKMVAYLKPEVIVDIGDWFDMNSLNGYDRPGSRSYQNNLYLKDIEAGLDAQRRFQAPIDAMNKRRRVPYQPIKIRCLGNHENRILRAIEAEPRLAGALSMSHLQSEAFGWQEVPFLEPIQIDGVVYQHYQPSGVMGRPIGGENPATMLLKKRHVSCTVGHLHTLDYSERNEATGRRIIGLVAGCFFEHDEPYAGPGVSRMWRRGIALKHHVRGGEYDLEWWSMERIRERWG